MVNLSGDQRSRARDPTGYLKALLFFHFIISFISCFGMNGVKHGSFEYSIWYTTYVTAAVYGQPDRSRQISNDSTHRPGSGELEKAIKGLFRVYLLRVFAEK